MHKPLRAKALIKPGFASFQWLTGLRLLLFAILIAPIAVLIIFALVTLFQRGFDFPTTTAIRSFTITAQLMLGVGLAAGLLGLGTAFATSYYSFYGRRFLQWALVLPIALPTYIAAYIWLELFEFTGPLQSVVRTVTGAKTLKDYWFPDIRNYWGAVFVLSLVLYPYIYLTCSTLFRFQSGHQIEAARALGGSDLKIFFTIALPFVRPALVVGIALALMELLNDVGAVEAFGQNTLSLTILSTWINRGSLGGATQIAVILLILVTLLLGLEHVARAQQSKNRTAAHTLRPLQKRRLKPLARTLACILCALPVFLGFVIPILFLAFEAIRHYDASQLPRFWGALLQTFSLSGIAATLAVAVALITSFTMVRDQRRLMHAATRPVTFGYALPGTVLAIGLVMILSSIDHTINDIVQSLGGKRLGLLLSGSSFILIMAYLIRFNMLAHANLESALLCRGNQLHDASRSLGVGFFKSFWRVDVPALKPALIASFLIVFIEAIKELPATIMLRPIGLDTLPIIIFEQASLEAFEVAALPALTLALLSTVSVYVLTQLNGHAHSA